MAPREGCPLRSGDWCSRLSWPGTPVTSFRWGRVATITVSPGGAAVLRVGMHLAGPLAFRVCGQLPLVSVAEAPPPTTGTFHAAGCVSFRAGAFDAVGDSNPVPQRARRPRPHRNVPTRAECPQPRRPSVGHPWHPEPLVRQLHQRRPPSTTSGPHTDARSGQTEQDAATSSGGEAPSRGVRAPGPVDLTLAELTRPAAQCPQR